MCGRFTLRTPAHRLAEAFGVRELPNLAPRYNIAPTQDVAAVRRGAGGGPRELVFLRWGLIPSWAKDASIGNRMINARAETVAEKPAFRAAFRHRRCLVAADGFYEWQKVAGGKNRPHPVRLNGDAPFAIAAITFSGTSVVGIESARPRPDMIEDPNWQQRMVASYDELRESGRTTGFRAEVLRGSASARGRDQIVYLHSADIPDNFDDPGSNRSSYWVAWVLDNARIERYLRDLAHAINSDLPLTFDIRHQSTPGLGGENVRFDHISLGLARPEKRD